MSAATMAKRVRDLMHPGVITCRPDATLGQIAVMLIQHRVHALYVADLQNRVMGVITDFDLLTGEWLSTDEPSLAAMRTMTAGELMSTPPMIINAEAPITEAARLMKEDGYKRLLVTHDNQQVGVVSLSDLIASLATTTPITRGTVADVMARVMLVCRRETRVADIARGMTTSGYRSVLVVAANGTPMGVVSGLDILAAVEDRERQYATAEEVLHPALMIQPTASLREAADLMIEHHHHRIVVVDPDDTLAMPIGIISSVDIVAQMAQPGSIWQTV
jgi:CBS domain-containing protein